MIWCVLNLKTLFDRIVHWFFSRILGFRLVRLNETGVSYGLRECVFFILLENILVPRNWSPHTLIE
jgi:hypothetical protein